MKKRDVGQEILEGINVIKGGKGRRFEVVLPSSRSFVKLTKSIRLNKKMKDVSFEV